jgi:hypothetical protein
MIRGCWRGGDYTRGNNDDRDAVLIARLALSCW